MHSNGKKDLSNILYNCYMKIGKIHILLSFKCVHIISMVNVPLVIYMYIYIHMCVYTKIKANTYRSTEIGYQIIADQWSWYCNYSFVYNFYLPCFNYYLLYSLEISKHRIEYSHYCKLNHNLWIIFVIDNL